MSVGVSGLALRFAFDDDKKPSSIAGPLIYAALGAAWAGAEAKLLGVISEDVSVEEVAQLREAGVAVEAAERREEASPILRTGRHSVSQNGLIGRPLDWSPSFFKASSLSVHIAASGDPGWLSRQIGLNPPAFLAADMHLAWIKSRPRQVATIIEQCDFLSATCEELATLPLCLVESARDRGVIILEKRGSAGATITRWGKTIDLPPVPTSNVRCEIGAGDFLLGAMHIGSLADESNRLDAFVKAYIDAQAGLAILLDCLTPSDLYLRISHFRKRGGLPLGSRLSGDN